MMSPIVVAMPAPRVVPVSIASDSTLSMPRGVSIVIQFTEWLATPAVVKRAHRPNCQQDIGFSVVKAVHGP